MTRPTPSQLAQAAVNSARNAKVTSSDDQRFWYLAESIEYLALAFAEFAVIHGESSRTVQGASGTVGEPRG